MIRKLFLLAVMAVAAFAFSASSASAVTVEGAGANEITANNTISIHTILPSGEITGLKCINHWSGSVSSSGAISLGTINIDGGAGTVGNCAAADDCGGSGWTGQIEEDSPHFEYNVHFTFCISGQGGPFDGVTKTVECEITNTEGHCGGTHDGAADEREEEANIGLVTIAPGVTVPFYVEGEVAISNSLGLMH